MTSREQFEAWIKSETGFDLWRTNYPMTKPEDQQYKDHFTNLAWMAWQASREAVEIALPDVCAWNLCELLDKKEVIEAIRTAGIKVKGE